MLSVATKEPKPGLYFCLNRALGLNCDLSQAARISLQLNPLCTRGNTESLPSWTCVRTEPLIGLTHP
jgi:hypothetical protein